MKSAERIRLGPAVFAVGLISLITLAVGTGLLYSLLMLATIAASVVLYYMVFPGSRFFAIELGNFLGVYACIFIFFVEANFEAVNPVLIQIGFAMPMVAFLGGAWFQRETIRKLLEAPRLQEERHFGRAFLWLVPVTMIGALTFVVADLAREGSWITVLYFGSMGLISLIVLWVSRDVCIFLLDTGLLFEDFFRRVTQLLVPTFAFFTYYSMIVIVFAAIYRIIDRFSVDAHFLVIGEARDLTFTECLYFSIITLSTVGYGDMVPLSSPIRLIVSVQIVCGVVLLLFGLSEIISYSREYSRRKD